MLIKKIFLTKQSIQIKYSSWIFKAFIALIIETYCRLPYIFYLFFLYKFHVILN